MKRVIIVFINTFICSAALAETPSTGSAPGESVPLPLTGIVEISVGGKETIAVDSSGHVWHLPPASASDAKHDPN